VHKRKLINYTFGGKNMKKLLEKITSVALAVVSILFIALVWVVMFKPAIAADFNTSLVKAFVIILSSAFLILSGLNIYSSFVDNERLSDVLLFKDRESATKATVGVVKKTAKRITKNMEEAKIRKVTLYSDASGNISMNVEVKVRSDKTMDVITNVRALLIETFDEIFGIEFSAINFRVITSKNKFVPNDADVKAKVEALKATIVSNKPAPGKVQTSKVTGHIEEKVEEVEAADIAKETEESSEEIPEETPAEQAQEIISEENDWEDKIIEEKAEEVAAEEKQTVEEITEDTTVEESKAAEEVTEDTTVEENNAAEEVTEDTTVEESKAAESVSEEAIEKETDALPETTSEEEKKEDEIK
jgi:hypothetical protein